jgi:hypothetical protein
LSIRFATPNLKNFLFQLLETYRKLSYTGLTLFAFQLEVMMQTVVAYLLILIGIAMEVISVLAWLGVIKPVREALSSATFWDVLLELTKRAPWPAIVGLLMIYAGLKLLGVPLPF